MNPLKTDRQIGLAQDDTINQSQSQKEHKEKKTKEQEGNPYLKDWDHVNHITEGNDYTRNDGWTAWVNECMGIDIRYHRLIPSAGSQSIDLHVNE